MAEEYDIFISYRRYEDAERSKENISKAGRLSEVFLRKGYKVFFDQNERTAKALKEKILPAVRRSRCFLLFLTESCLERCKSEGDWVRQEIETAIEAGKKIVPVTLDNAIEQWPAGLPESLKYLSDNGGIDITNIHNDTSYQSDIDGLINDVIGLPQERGKGAEVHIETDYDCHVLRFKQELMLARRDEDNVVYLRRGKHRLVFEAEGCREVKKKEDVEIPDADYSTFVDVKLSEEVKKKLEQMEIERQEKEKREREEREREKRERDAWDEFEVKGVKFKMVKVEGGTFMMGATEEQGTDAFDREKPVHQVTLSDYYIGETVVTQELWKAVMGNNPSKFTGDNERSVEMVSWEEAQEFIEKLNRETGREFRLPTEAEWEYAARGGNKSQGYKYSGSDNLDEVAWYRVNSGDKTHPVKEKKSNEIGLYDMSGNVWEWCQDWFGKYSRDAQLNPQGSFKGAYRVARGGSWFHDARFCRVSYRGDCAQMLHYFNLGFRLVMSL